MMRDFLNFVERDGALHEEECFLGALIGGAVSLVGGLMGRSDAKKRDAAAAKAAKVPVISNTSHEVDLKALNAAAIAAGYNPMTILNAGGLSAFTKTRTETTGQNAMAAVPTAPSVGSVVAGAASSAFNIWRDDRQAAAQTAALSASSFPPAPRPGNSLMAVLTGTAAGGASGGGGLQFAAVPRLTQKASAGMPLSCNSAKTLVNSVILCVPAKLLPAPRTMLSPALITRVRSDPPVNFTLMPLDAPVLTSGSIWFVTFNATSPSITA
ncbi:hypothetical protein VTU32_12355 [Thermoanaerobacter sp. CM-CNRG TB177]|uniref:hypothetical protein n=1 Tax=Thermoanaerobacter sp. CM-CNRG TB177 TaxID=2800659 RepID=UPI00316E35BE